MLKTVRNRKSYQKSTHAILKSLKQNSDTQESTPFHFKFQIGNQTKMAASWAGRKIRSGRMLSNTSGQLLVKLMPLNGRSPERDSIATQALSRKHRIRFDEFTYISIIQALGLSVSVLVLELD